MLLKLVGSPRVVLLEGADFHINYKSLRDSYLLMIIT